MGLFVISMVCGVNLVNRGKCRGVSIIPLKVRSCYNLCRVRVLL